MSYQSVATHAHAEILDQPEAIGRVLRHCVSLQDGTAQMDELVALWPNPDAVSRLLVVGTGSAYHAGLLGQRIIEVLARIPVDVEPAGARRGAPRRTGEGTWVVALARSGEEPETVDAVRRARARGRHVIAITGATDSTVAREAEVVLWPPVEAERGLTATRSFTAHVVGLLLLGLNLGRRRGLTVLSGRKFLGQMLALPNDVTEALNLEPAVRAIAEQCAGASQMLVLGQGIHHPLALEGALQLATLARVSAEGHWSLDTRTGPLSAVTPGMPVVFLALWDAALPAMLKAMQNAQLRGARVVAMISEDCGYPREFAEHQLVVPATAPLLAPIVNVVPLQLLAYHLAVLKGLEVDCEPSGQG